jgi:hypothetical protein
LAGTLVKKPVIIPSCIMTSELDLSAANVDEKTQVSQRHPAKLPNFKGNQ